MATQNKKQNTASGGLYIALAICVLSVICIGVYSAVISIFDTTGNISNSENNKAPQVTLQTPTTSSKTPVVTNKTPQTEVDANLPDEAPEQNVNAQPTPPSYTMPVGGDVLKEFSGEVLVYSTTMNDYRVHKGTDLSAAIGTQVKAFTSGVVTEIFEDPLMGHTIVVDHGGGVISRYQNLSEAYPEGIAVGVEVEEGQVIAGVGESCLIECAQEPHLHFEVMVNDAYVDPMNYFR